jgi:hypothetical protein
VTASNTTIKRRVLKAIRTNISAAEEKASSLREDPDKRRYAFLFDHAVRFWSDVHYAIDNGREPSSREQAFVIGHLRENATDGGGA